MMKNNKRIYIARDLGYYDNKGEKIEGDLKIFCSIPLPDTDPNVCGIVWSNVGQIAIIPSYMYPEIKEGQYGEFILNQIIKK